MARAALAVDTGATSFGVVKGPTLIAENDPYNAVRSTAKPKAKLPPQRNLKSLRHKNHRAQPQKMDYRSNETGVESTTVTPADKTPSKKSRSKSAAPSQSVRWMKSLPATF